MVDEHYGCVDGKMNERRSGQKRIGLENGVRVGEVRLELEAWEEDIRVVILKQNGIDERFDFGKSSLILKSDLTLSKVISAEGTDGNMSSPLSISVTLGFGWRTWTPYVILGQWYSDGFRLKSDRDKEAWNVKVEVEGLVEHAFDEATDLAFLPSHQLALEANLVGWCLSWIDCSY